VAILESTVGHQKIHEALVHALAQGRLPSQFLFVGPEGVGKRRFALGMAEVLLCLRPPAVGKACGLCSSCVKIAAGYHENLLVVEPEKSLIKIDKARDIRDFLSLAQEGPARVIIVDDAHTLNAQASNALLKVFEEPPPNTYFFFITHRWTQVLATIRSRATRVAFAPLQDQDLARWAKGDAELIRLARGSVRELKQQQEPEAQEVRAEARSLMLRFFTEKGYFVLGEWRDSMKDRDKLLLFIRYWLLDLRDFLLARATESGALPKGPLGEALLKFSAEEHWDLWERGLQLEPALLGYRDPVLVVEEWLMPLMIKKVR
jgi:DNA polymerase-3 subunit delta'